MTEVRGADIAFDDRTLTGYSARRTTDVNSYLIANLANKVKSAGATLASLMQPRQVALNFAA